MYHPKSEVIPSRLSLSSCLLVAIPLLVLLGIALVASPFVALVGFCVFIVVLPLLLIPEYAMYVFAVLPILGGSVAIALGQGVFYKIAHFGAVILLLSWCIARLSNSRMFVPGILKRHNIHYVLFLFWALLSILWSYDRTYGLNDLILLFLALSTLYISANILANKKIIHIVFMLIISIGLINALLSLLFPYFSSYIAIRGAITENIGYMVHIWDYHYSHTPMGRTQGLTGPHTTAAFLAVPIVLSMMLFSTTLSKKKRVFFFLLAVIMLAGMLATLSKMPLFSVVLGVAYVMFHIKPLRRFFVANMLKFLMLVVLLFCLARIHNIHESFLATLRALDIIPSRHKVTSLGGRLDLMKLGMKEIGQTVGLGCGIGGFRSLAISSGLTIDAAHQMILYELGFVGLMLWLFLLIAAYRLFTRTLRNTADEYYRRILIIYIGGYISLMAMWVFTANYNDIYLWFYIGIGYALVHMSEECPTKEVSLPFHKPGESIVDM